MVEGLQWACGRGAAVGLWWRGCSGLVVEGLQWACGGGAAVGLWWRGCSGLVVEGLQWACGRGAAVGLWWSIDVCCSTYISAGGGHCGPRDTTAQGNCLYSTLLPLCTKCSCSKCSYVALRRRIILLGTCLCGCECAVQTWAIFSVCIMHASDQQQQNAVL